LGGHTGIFLIRKERESLSFFDEADEPRTPPRTRSRSRRPPGRGRRPPTDQQSIQVRRAIAAVAIIVILVLIILGIHSCQVSARNSSLRDYNNNVNSLIQRSNQTGAALFRELSGGGGASNATGLQTSINATLANAKSQYQAAQQLSVPSEVQGAQQNLLLVLKMRQDGIANIANKIQPALGTTTSKDAINAIAAEMAKFYASDVLYKDYTVPMINAALINALGPNSGATFNGGQVLPSLGWLTPSFVANQLHVSLPQPATAKCVSGQAVGHHINSVSVGGTTLQTGSTNTIVASPAPTFTLNITNGGQTTISNVILKVSVSGTSVKGQTTIPQTTPGQTTSGQVTLSSTPPSGTQTVVAEVVPVHCEVYTAHNTLSFPVTFQ
jgi:hypothetical protein